MRNQVLFYPEKQQVDSCILSKFSLALPEASQGEFLAQNEFRHLNPLVTIAFFYKVMCNG